jgi:hypothetical protein
LRVRAIIGCNDALLSIVTTVTIGSRGSLAIGRVLDPPVRYRRNRTILARRPLSNILAGRLLRVLTQTGTPAGCVRYDRIANRLHDMWKGATKAKWEFPPKPYRMRWKTYRRVKQQYYELQGRWTSRVMARFGIKV